MAVKTKIEKWQGREVCMSIEDLEAIKEKAKEEGLIEGRAHTFPAPDTIKFMGETKTALKSMTETNIKLVEELKAFKDLNKEQHDNLKISLDSILEQTKKTNGRVSTLEDKQDKLRYWKAYISGGLAVVILLLSVFGAVLLNYVLNH